MADEMKNCPFCGLDVNEDEGCFPVRMDRSVWEVRCGNPYCFGHSPDAPTREAAIAKWNRRALSHAAGQDGEQCRAASGDADLGTWLWGKLMDFCQKRRMPLAEYNDLFEIVDELRALSRGVPEGK